MQHLAGMRILYSFSDGLEILRRLAEGQGLIADQLSEIAPLYQVHRKERLTLMVADFVDGNDVRVVQLRGGLRLRAKTLHAGGIGKMAAQHQFDGNGALQAD